MSTESARKPHRVALRRPPIIGDCVDCADGIPRRVTIVDTEQGLVGLGDGRFHLTPDGRLDYSGESPATLTPGTPNVLGFSQLYDMREHREAPIFVDGGSTGATPIGFPTLVFRQVS